MNYQAANKSNHPDLGTHAWLELQLHCAEEKASSTLIELNT